MSKNKPVESLDLFADLPNPVGRPKQFASNAERQKAYRARLKANGKHTTVAQVAVIKKMIVIAHALYVNNCVYDAVFYKKQCGVNREMGVCA